MSLCGLSTSLVSEVTCYLAIDATGAAWTAKTREVWTLSVDTSVGIGLGIQGTFRVSNVAEVCFILSVSRDTGVGSTMD